MGPSSQTSPIMHSKWIPLCPESCGTLGFPQTTLLDHHLFTQHFITRRLNGWDSLNVLLWPSQHLGQDVLGTWKLCDKMNVPSETVTETTTAQEGQLEQQQCCSTFSFLCLAHLLRCHTVTLKLQVPAYLYKIHWKNINQHIGLWHLRGGSEDELCICSGPLVSSAFSLQASGLSPSPRFLLQSYDSCVWGISFQVTSFRKASLTTTRLKPGLQGPQLPVMPSTIAHIPPCLNYRFIYSPRL